MSTLSLKTRKLTATALFAAISTILMFISFPLPFFPPFLKLDLSNVPVMLAAFMFGAGPGVVVAFIKAVINALASTSGGVGELSDFIVAASFSVTAALVYRRRHSRNGAIWACLLATAVMTIVGMLSNRFLIIPFYSTIMPIEAILSACAAVNPLIGDINTYILLGAGPFNLLKGAVISLLTVLLYKRLSSLVKGPFKELLSEQ